MTDPRLADPANPLATGDALAEAGNWPAAIDAWQDAVSGTPSLRPAVELRLEWLLAETGTPCGSSRRIVPLILTCVVAVALGMAFLLLADEPGTASANLWAIASWGAITVAAVSALIAARRSGEAPLGRMVAAARRAAKRVNHDPAAGESR